MPGTRSPNLTLLPDLAAGLREMRRVTHGPIVILSCDPALVEAFWGHLKVCTLNRAKLDEA